MKHEIQMTVNGQLLALSVESQEILLDVLRDRLALFGARESCGMSVCGACTVLIDDVPASSCTYFAALANRRSIMTIEGVANGDALHPLQQAFIEHGAFQCSYCTPGMVLTALSLLREKPHPTEAEIRDYLSGNLCRCSAYPEILAAIKTVAAQG